MSSQVTQTSSPDIANGHQFLRVLLVEDQEDDAILLVRELYRAGFQVQYEQVTTPAAMHAALDRQTWDIILADYSLPHFSGPAALKLLQGRGLNLPFIMVSGTVDEAVAVSALKVGAHDFVTKENLARLAPAIDRGLREVEERHDRLKAEDALRRSEERYRELVENANDIVFTVDLEGNFTSLNAAGEVISGYGREELSEMNMAQVLPPDSLERAVRMIRQKLEDDKPTMYDLDLIAKDGHRVPLEVSTRLITHDGKPIGIQGIARDITERRRAAQALRESEERYRGLFQNASDIVYTHDLEGNFTSTNQATQQILGYSQEDLIGLNISNVVAPDQLQRALSMIHRKLDEEPQTTYELDVISKEGSRLTLEINSQLIYQHGNPQGVQGIARDVTQRRKAEKELRAREQKQAAIAGLGQRTLASTGLAAVFEDAVTTVARTLDIEYCTILELLPDGKRLVARAGVGWRTGLVGATVGAGPESQAGYALFSSEPVVMENLSTETRFSIPAVLSEHDVQSGMSVIVHGSSRPFGVVSAFSSGRHNFTQDDVHFLQAMANVLSTGIERTRMEEERARHTRELATRVIQAQEEERKRIARELHDETAQSLSMLLTNLDLLVPHIRERDAALKSGFERVEALARRTLDETRALSHDLRPTILDDVGLAAALEWITGEYQLAFGGSASVEAEAQKAHALSPEIEVALFRIAQEAVNNSGKHAQARSVSVSLTFPDSIARLVVEDDGKGFDPKHISGPTRQGRLGLYGMHERAELLGGTLTLTTSPGQGTKIVVDVPLRQSSPGVTA